MGVDAVANPEMANTRKKIKAKRRLQQKDQHPAADEEVKGEEDDLSFEDSQEDEYEVEDIVQRPESDDEGEGEDDDWEDCDSDEPNPRKQALAAAIQQAEEAVAASETPAPQQ